MGALIKEEGDADQEKLDWCNKERTENDAALKKAKKGILSLNQQINRLENTIGKEKTGLKDQIAETEKSLTENVASQKEKTEFRTADHLEKSLADGMNAFVQEDPTPPQALGDDKYEGQSTQGNAVLKMLNFILDETN